MATTLCSCFKCVSMAENHTSVCSKKLLFSTQKWGVQSFIFSLWLMYENFSLPWSPQIWTPMSKDVFIANNSSQGKFGFSQLETLKAHKHQEALVGPSLHPGSYECLLQLSSSTVTLIILMLVAIHKSVMSKTISNIAPMKSYWYLKENRKTRGMGTKTSP